jgi:hypothetical protein
MGEKWKSSTVVNAAEEKCLKIFVGCGIFKIKDGKAS